MALPTVTGWGHLGAEPECRRVDEGGTWIATFSLAFNHKWTDKHNIGHKQTTWLHCVAWAELAHQIAAARLPTGKLVFVRGDLKHERRPDDNGHTKDSYELTVRELHLPLPRLADGAPGGAGGGVAPGPPG